jgi:hypothetical protein
MVKKSDLKDQILTDDESILVCPICFAEFSANSGDYWYLEDDFIFTCSECEVEMKLMKKYTTYEEIK